MTILSARELCGLLTRARAALETPGDLDDAAQAALIEDLAVAEREAISDAAFGGAWIASDDPGIEQGRYCVLSTAHVSLATSEWLERWSVGPPPPAPVPVATTFYGWFVSTREPAAPAEPLPADLRAAMRFGRTRGFDYLLFDSDAAQVEGLAVHDW